MTVSFLVKPKSQSTFSALAPDSHSRNSRRTAVRESDLVRHDQYDDGWGSTNDSRVTADSAARLSVGRLVRLVLPVLPLDSSQSPFLWLHPTTVQ